MASLVVMIVAFALVCGLIFDLVVYIVGCWLSFRV